MDRIYRFGVFSFDAGQLELRRLGQPVRLQPQPAQVLALLVERAGRVVTRDELRQAVWGSETFVDFDRGLNFCIAQIRAALTDTAGTPRYIRTIPKRGYEFICPLGTEARPEAATSPQPDAARQDTGRRVVAAAAVLTVAILAMVAFRMVGAFGPHHAVVAVIPFDNETSDPSLTRFGEYLTDSVVERLASAGGGQFRVIGNAAILRTAREHRDLRVVASSLGANFVILGQVQRDGTRVRVLGHLIRLPDQTHVAVARFDNVADQSLTTTDDIASQLAAKFVTPLLRAGS